MLIFVSFYSSNNPEKMYSTVLNIDNNNNNNNNNNKMFPEQQISLLEWFLKDHVTLKTGVMMLKNASQE